MSEFVGRVNLWTGTVRESGPHEALVEVGPGVLLRVGRPAPVGATVQLAVRPEAIRIVPARDAGHADAFPLRVRSMRFIGASALVVGELPGGVPVIVQGDAGAADELPLEGAAVAIDPGAVSVFVDRDQTEEGRS